MANDKENELNNSMPPPVGDDRLSDDRTSVWEMEEEEKRQREAIFRKDEEQRILNEKIAALNALAKSNSPERKAFFEEHNQRKREWDKDVTNMSMEEFRQYRDNLRDEHSSSPYDMVANVINKENATPDEVYDAMARMMEFGIMHWGDAVEKKFALLPEWNLIQRKPWQEAKEDLKEHIRKNLPIANVVEALETHSLESREGDQLKSELQRLFEGIPKSPFFTDKGLVFDETKIPKSLLSEALHIRYRNEGPQGMKTLAENLRQQMKPQQEGPQLQQPAPKVKQPRVWDFEIDEQAPAFAVEEQRILKKKIAALNDLAKSDSPERKAFFEEHNQRKQEWDKDVTNMSMEEFRQYRDNLRDEHSSSPYDIVANVISKENATLDEVYDAMARMMEFGVMHWGGAVDKQFTHLPEWNLTQRKPWQEMKDGLKAYIQKNVSIANVVEALETHSLDSREGDLLKFQLKTLFDGIPRSPFFANKGLVFDETKIPKSMVNEAVRIRYQNEGPQGMKTLAENLRQQMKPQQESPQREGPQVKQSVAREVREAPKPKTMAGPSI